MLDVGQLSSVADLCAALMQCSSRCTHLEQLHIVRCLHVAVAAGDEGAPEDRAEQLVLLDSEAGLTEAGREAENWGPMQYWWCAADPARELQLQHVRPEQALALVRQRQVTPKTLLEAIVASRHTARSMADNIHLVLMHRGWQCGMLVWEWLYLKIIYLDQIIDMAIEELLWFWPADICQQPVVQAAALVVCYVLVCVPTIYLLWVGTMICLLGHAYLRRPASLDDQPPAPLQRYAVSVAAAVVIIPVGLLLFAFWLCFSLGLLAFWVIWSLGLGVFLLLRAFKQPPEIEFVKQHRQACRKRRRVLSGLCQSQPMNTQYISD